ncbi:hypothetical protein EES43_29575 [Streptomyces sp. ADI96-02]|nr:hypothetical protein EES43_29575 [Streptomyces sp. ADI96-02]
MRYRIKRYVVHFVHLVDRHPWAQSARRDQSV